MIARLRTVPWGAVIAVLAGIALAIGMTYLLRQQRVSADERAQQSAAISSLADSLAEANQRLEAAGEAPVEIPPAAPAAPQQGEQGDPGRPPTQAEIDLSVEAYCSVRNDCAGPPGDTPAPARDGQPGKDGVSVRGEKGDKGDSGDPGRPPSADEVLAAVSAFCGQATAPCKGPAGDAGAPGTQGAGGRGITSVVCQDDGTWLVTYTDQTTSTTPGPCRFTLIPTPEETS